jgi:hypothetical protein
VAPFFRSLTARVRRLPPLSPRPIYTYQQAAIRTSSPTNKQPQTYTHYIYIYIYNTHHTTIYDISIASTHLHALGGDVHTTKLPRANAFHGRKVRPVYLLLEERFGRGLARGVRHGERIDFLRLSECVRGGITGWLYFSSLALVSNAVWMALQMLCPLPLSIWKIMLIIRPCKIKIRPEGEEEGEKKKKNTCVYNHIHFQMLRPTEVLIKKTTYQAIVLCDVPEDIKLRVRRGHGGRVLDGLDEILVQHVARSALFKPHSAGRHNKKTGLS